MSKSNSNIEERILKQLSEHPVLIYMKGVPDAPECGFSAKAVSALKSTGVPFTYVNVLGAPFIREKLPKISKWPTYPQLFINGELIGGCDIIEAMNEDGSLTSVLKAALAETTTDNAVISHSEVENLIKAEYPDATVLIEGEGCDLTITVISEQFEGQTMVKQQQGVMAALNDPITSGRLHAVTLKIYTPALSEKEQTLKPESLLQIQG